MDQNQGLIKQPRAKEPSQKRVGFDGLHRDALFDVLLRCDVPELLQLSKTCTYIRDVVLTKLLWLVNVKRLDIACAPYIPFGVVDVSDLSCEKLMEIAGRASSVYEKSLKGHMEYRLRQRLKLVGPEPANGDEVNGEAPRLHSSGNICISPNGRYLFIDWSITFDQDMNRKDINILQVYDFSGTHFWSLQLSNLVSYDVAMEGENAVLLVLDKYKSEQDLQPILVYRTRIYHLVEERKVSQSFEYQMNTEIGGDECYSKFHISRQYMASHICRVSDNGVQLERVLLVYWRETTTKNILLEQREQTVLQQILQDNYLFVVARDYEMLPSSVVTMYAFDLDLIFAAEEDSVYLDQALCSLPICRSENQQHIAKVVLSPPCELVWQGRGDQTLLISVCAIHWIQWDGGISAPEFSMASVVFDKGISSGFPSFKYDIPFEEIRFLRGINVLDNCISKGGTCLLPMMLDPDRHETLVLLQLTRTGPPKVINLPQIDAIYRDHDPNDLSEHDGAMLIDKHTNALICILEPKSSKEGFIDIYDPY